MVEKGASAEQLRGLEFRQARLDRMKEQTTEEDYQRQRADERYAAGLKQEKQMQSELSRLRDLLVTDDQRLKKQLERVEALTLAGKLQAAEGALIKRQLILEDQQRKGRTAERAAQSMEGLTSVWSRVAGAAAGRRANTSIASPSSGVNASPASETTAQKTATTASSTLRVLEQIKEVLLAVKGNLPLVGAYGV